MMASMEYTSDTSPCTPEELEDIITAPCGGLTLLPSDAYNQVYEGVFLGDESIARDRIQLRRMGITHILNAALGHSNFHVDTNADMYKCVGIKFLGIEATDFMNFNLTPWFGEASAFIDEGLQNGGKVMVHCKVGCSRSAALVLAFLMVKHHIILQDAVRLVRKNREICPNYGFLQQLCNYYGKLKKSGHFNNCDN